MLQASGFRVEAVWGDFFGEPYSAESERLMLLAQKVMNGTDGMPADKPRSTRPCG